MKGRKKLKESEDDDFSKLPDDVFHNILSLLPTKDLVRTSVLSKRWLNLWTYSTNIDIDHTRPSFIYSVEQVLLHCHAPYLEKVRLSSCPDFFSFGVKISACRIRSWICSAIHHRVQELDLNLLLNIDDYYDDDYDYDVVLPPRFFSCKSLTSVKLHRAYCLKIPSSSICLPNLKTLHLNYTIFLDEQSTQRFFSGLPALQDLVLNECDWSNVRKVTIYSPSLKSLTFSSYVDYYDIIDWEINIYASSLTSLHCSGSPENNLVLHGMESLVDAVIELDNGRCEDDDVGIDIIRSAHRAKSLTVSDSVFKILRSCPHNLDQIRLPMFYNLNRLVVHQFDYRNVKGLTILLQRSPNLEYLEMTEVMAKYNVNAHEWILEADSLCFKSNLRKLRISDFTGNEAEMLFIKFMLKNVPLLDTHNMIEPIRKIVSQAHQLRN